MRSSLVAVLLAPVAWIALSERVVAQTYSPIYGIRHVAPPEIWSIDLETGQASFVSRNMKQTKVACARHPRNRVRRKTAPA